MSRGRPAWAPWLRGGLLAAVLLAVFVPLLASADPRLGAVIGDAAAAVARFLGRLGLLPRLDEVVVRGFVFVPAALGLAAAVAVAHASREGGPVPRRRGPAGGRVRPVLPRRVEWLLPLGALDALFAVFLTVRVLVPPAEGTTFAEQVHAGFAQLVVATVLVLGVVALAVRWTPMTAGPRAALAVLCALSLGLAAVAVADLHAYVEAYGLTRLRVGVAVICAGVAALLVVVLVAGARWQRRRRQPWVPHAAVLVAAAALLGLTVADPDALVARSQLARATDVEVDLWYLSTLSADAVPPMAAALASDPAALGADGRCLLGDVSGTLHPSDDDARWASANASRSRAATLAAQAGDAGTPWTCTDGYWFPDSTPAYPSSPDASGTSLPDSPSATAR